MSRRTALILLAATLAIPTGCSPRRPAPNPTPVPQSAAQRHPTTAETSFAELEPLPPPPATRRAASTQPAPLASLDLYAQARRAMLDNRRFTAIALLEQAIILDPDSFELHYSLGRAYVQPGSPPDKAIAAFETATTLDPEHLDARLQLARLYLTTAKSAEAITHLRRARETDAYKRGHDDDAALVDLHLARALNQKGYYRAALEQYESLADRLAHAGPSVRSNPELLFLINRPEILLAQTAQVRQSLGDYDAAIQGYDAALQRDPANFELHTNIVRCYTAQSKWNEAATRAAAAVRLFRASNESLDLLRDVYKRAGRPDDIVGELTRLQRERPEDRALLYALADVLHSQGKSADAQSLLAAQLEPQQYNAELVRRLFRLYQQGGQVDDAARLLIETMAANPEAQRETATLWDDLLRFSQKNRLRLANLQKLDVKPGAEAAKLYWIARVAQLWNRDQLARTSLEQAVRLPPPLPAAFRDRLAQIFSDPGTTDAAKSAAADALVRSADAQGLPALASELRGLLALHQKQPARALEAFDQAVKLGRPSIDLQLNYASALIQQGQTARAEQTLWRIVNDNPTYDEAYAFLFQYYLNQQNGPQAIKVLQTWATADPTSVSARVVQANVYLQAKRPEAAKQLIEPLFDQYPDNAEVLSASQAFYAQTGQLDEYVKKLEDERTRNPQNRIAAEQLVRLYGAQDRTAAATRVLDSMRADAANDVDYLYYISHLYNSLGQKETAEQVLLACLNLDPNYSPAANDLGYTWADQGKNLPRAESLIRLAVEAEPDNHSYLDSLGWVLYKNGKFPDAAKYLKQAVDAAVHPDPVVLDHLGDVLYRLGQKDDAVKNWKRSNDQLPAQSSDREDIKTLRLHLETKLKQAEKDAPITVAPVGSEKPPPSQQAKQ
jgi:tetratricopeptide (TPR) repeat protein